MPDMTRSSGTNRQHRIFVRWICFLLMGAGLALCGCTSSNLTLARNAFYSGDVVMASQALDEPEKVGSRDRLLYFMEKGTILHYGGDYEGSAAIFLQAAALITEQEVISATRQAASMVTTEWLTKYKGEYVERLFVHTFQMMNYLLLGKHESALVEAKQALEVYDTYPEACDGDYFTRALIAHCFEALDEINGAYIEYKKLAELMGNPAPVADKLCQLANRLGFYDEVEHFSQFLPDKNEEKRERPIGERLIFLSRGRAPVKIPHDIILPESIRFSFSTYENRGGYFPGPEIPPLPGIGTRTRVTTDVGKVLRASLDQRLARIIAKETARVVAKEAIANNINDSGVESLVRIAFFLMEVPDTRCWETLPGTLTLIREPVFPGDNEQAADGPDNPDRFYRYFSIRN